MDREQVMGSIALKKRFSKDCKLPIAIYDNPYFYERLCTLDVIFDCVDKFEDFCCELQSFKDEGAYFEYYNLIKDQVVTYIRNQEAFDVFNNKEVFPNIDKMYPKHNLYIDENDGRTFISIDMRKANFSALNYYSGEIFNNCASWEEFIRMFTDSEHIVRSKYFRQVVFGSCNPKRQVRYEKNLMHDLLSYISEAVDDELSVFSLDADEIILNVENYQFSMRALREIVSETPIGHLVKITIFDLNRIKGTNGWMKTFYNFDKESAADDVVEFKCLDAEIYHQVVKHYYNEVITDDDLVFYHNGKLAKFLEEVKNPWA